MIEYSDDIWALRIICMTNGSVLPKAFVWAFANAVVAAVLHWCLRSVNLPTFTGLDGEPIHFLQQMDGVTVIWSGYTAVLGFLVVFRNNQAYSRFWEGATLVNQTRGEWFNAISSLMAFCTTDKEKRTEVEHFQNLMVRLVSLLHCSALQDVCEIEDANLEILDVSGMDEDSLLFLEKVHDRCEIIMQWMQRLIMKSYLSGTLVAPAPILSRSFQELSRGVVNLNNVRKIRSIPFPFPYNQVLICMLAVHWAITPVYAAMVVPTAWWASLMCFFVTGSFWSVIYIAKEIDNPFGEDPNDLPMVEMQRDFNRSLVNLLDPLAQRIPGFVHQQGRAMKITERYVQRRSVVGPVGGDGGAQSKVGARRSRRSIILKEVDWAEDGAYNLDQELEDDGFSRQFTPLSEAFRRCKSHSSSLVSQGSQLGAEDAQVQGVSNSEGTRHSDNHSKTAGCGKRSRDGAGRKAKDAEPEPPEPGENFGHRGRTAVEPEGFTSEGVASEENAGEDKTGGLAVTSMREIASTPETAHIAARSPLGKDRESAEPDPGVDVVSVAAQGDDDKSEGSSGGGSASRHPTRTIKV